MSKPVATIIREALPVGIWLPAQSKTYKDTSYTKRKMTTRWASKDLRLMSAVQQDEVEERLTKLLVKTGLATTVLVWNDEILVRKETPITITEGF